MSDFLNTINFPEDVKNLSYKECRELAEEIRKFLIKSVSETGGHLASNLGVVELTIALYHVFDFPKDKVVWDVGHQAYVHKILSGRKDRFPYLRKFKGMSGFPKTSESEFDSFNTGHSSTSASAALGFARARDLSGENNNVIAVFGDGALTGGMMYEALNDAGHTKTKLILILNDNAMSISRNVGAVSKHLRNLRAKPGYFKSKRRVEIALSKIPFCGRGLSAFIRYIKKIARSIVLPPTIFDDLGCEYIGPVDGHNIAALIRALETAKHSRKPILLHIHTKKGKGYAPAENNPQFFHGVSHFDAESKQIDQTPKIDYSAMFGKHLVDIGEKNKKVVAITAAMPIGTGIDCFREKFKPRFFDVGIAEQHAATFAAGMAMSGYVPVIAVYSSFCQRAYDQILHDICLQNLHVVLGIDRAGIVGADGETHHGLYDIAYLSHMPYMTILSPSSFKALGEMMDYAINTHKGPIAIRYPRGDEEFADSNPFVFGKAEVLSRGKEVMLISSGRMMNTAKKVCESLKNKGILAGIIEVPTIMPLDAETIVKELRGVKIAAVIEDHQQKGGLGDIVASTLAREKVGVEFMGFAFPDKPVVHGTISELDKHYQMDAQSIAYKIKEKIYE